jgi:hypothetical protein
MSSNIVDNDIQKQIDYTKFRANMCLTYSLVLCLTWGIFITKSVDNIVTINPAFNGFDLGYIGLALAFSLLTALSIMLYIYFNKQLIKLLTK